MATSQPPREPSPSCLKRRANLVTKRFEKQHTYMATCPDGMVVTRTTKRTYTHVIVGRFSDWYWAAHRKQYQEEPGNFTVNSYWAITWAGTPALADKAEQKFARDHMHSRDADNGKLMYQDVQMIPCFIR